MTLAEIRSYLRVIIDQPHTAIWSNANLNTLINGAYREVVGEILQRNPDYFVKTGTVTTVANTYHVSLPSDCMLLNKLVDSDGEALLEKNMRHMNLGENAGEPTHIYVTGSQVRFWPKPSSAIAYTAYYHYMPSDLTEATSPELPPGLHDILAWGAAIKCKTGKEEAINEYVLQFQQKLKVLLRMIMISTTNESPRVKGQTHDFYLGFNS